MIDFIGPFLIRLLIIVLLFLLFRELVCWSLKINEKITLMYKQQLLLGRISDPLGVVETMS